MSDPKPGLPIVAPPSSPAEAPAAAGEERPALRDDDLHALLVDFYDTVERDELLAKFVQERMTKPVVGFIAGQTAPPGRRRST